MNDLLSQLGIRVVDRVLPQGIRGTLNFEDLWHPTITIDSNLDEGLISFVEGHEIGHFLLSMGERAFTYSPGTTELSAHDVERVCDRIGLELVLPAEWMTKFSQERWDFQKLSQQSMYSKVSTCLFVRRLGHFGSRLTYVVCRRDRTGVWLITETAGPKNLRDKISINMSALDRTPEGSNDPGSELVRSPGLSVYFKRTGNCIEALFAEV